jgi:hypothetical protein
MDYSKLSWYICRNEPTLLSKALEEATEDVDIFWHDNEFLKVSIGHNFVQITAVLIEYYEKKYLQGDSHSHEYIYKKNQLQDAIQEAIDSTCHDISPETMAIVGKYIRQEDDDKSSTADLDSLPDPSGDYEDEDVVGVLGKQNDEI